VPELPAQLTTNCAHRQAHISEALQARGLPSEGLKRELVNRLHSALQRAAVDASLRYLLAGDLL